MSDFASTGTPLTQQGVAAACDTLGVGPAETWAVISVETSGCGFLSDRRPKILFERHIFSRLTGGRFDADDPDVSQPTRGGYGPGGAHQFDRLEAAILLDRMAALKSASWGLGQVMGENFSAAGFPDIETMVAGMAASEDAQLAAMASFVKANAMQQLLQSHDWTSFARRYNGADYAANNYDGHLAQFFRQYSAGPAPDLRLRTVQAYLTYKGFAPGAIDGVAGPRTAAAVKAYQASIGVAQTGAIDDALVARLAA